MGQKIFSHVFGFALLATVPNVSFAGEVKVMFDTSVEVAEPGLGGLTNRASYLNGQEVVFPSGKLFWVQASGKIPMLVIPAAAIKGEEVPRIKMPDVAAWPAEVTEKEIEGKVSKMVDDIQLFQASLARKDYKEAELILTKLEATQNINYLNFLRSSLAFLKGDVTTARKHVERGLERSPANVQGQRLLKALGESK